MTEQQAIEYIIERGDRHGLSFDEVLDMIPRVLHDDLTECAEFLEMRHISHILPQSTHPELANDPSNMILEEPGANLSRGAEPMSEAEELIATLDNEVLATQIDGEIPLPVDDPTVVIDLIPDYIPILGIA